ncbi:MAG: hypothetical protein ACYS6K_13025 [Planctomycetota bacterium]
MVTKWIHHVTWKSAGLCCIHRYIEEANLTETKLGQDASLVAVSREPDVFCRYVSHINRGIVGIVGHPERPGKLGSSIFAIAW